MDDRVAKPPFEETLPPQLHDLLATRRNAILGTWRRGGGPLLCPVWYLWDGARFTISAPAETAKVEHVRARPEASVCVDDPDAGRYVTAYGRGEVVEGDEVADLTRPLLLKYMHEDEADARWGWLTRRQTRVVIVMRPERLVWRLGVH